MPTFTKINRQKIKGKQNSEFHKYKKSQEFMISAGPKN